MHNRRVETEAEYLSASVAALPVAEQTTIEVQRRGGRIARQAILSVSFGTLTIQPPRNHRQRHQFTPVTLQVVVAEEEHPPVGETPVRWLLLTTLAVTTLEQALQCVHWYSLRWLIERYHYVLKSGCGIEQLQLRSRARLERALATYSIVAWRLLWLTYQARQYPDLSCETVLEPHEWQALAARIQKQPKPPQQPPTLAQAVRWIARLGGFLARRGDGDPGVKTLWRGLTRLHDIAETWKLIHEPPLRPRF